MRSVFVIDIPAQQDGHFPANLQVLELVRKFGWEPVEITLLDDDVSKKKGIKS